MSRDHQTIADLTAIAGSDNIILDAKKLAFYGTDHSKILGDPLLAVTPRDKQSVARLLSYCNNHRLVVVPSGGRTGLAGGATAGSGEIVLSLEKMQHIEPVDHINMSITVEAGAITQEVQQRARDAGYCFPIDLAARGTSQIGGNIATNAGGMKVLRYGMTRENILGLEVALADGTFLDLNDKLGKNNTGYDLKQLFIGSEGTLGVITAASLRLKPLIKDHRLVVLAVNDVASLMHLLDSLRHSHLPVSACEIMLQYALEFMIRNGDIVNPFAREWPFYCFVEFELEHPYVTQAVDLLLEQLLQDGIITDGILPMSSQETLKLWKIRENINETVSRHTHVKKHDIALPISAMGPFLEEFAAFLDQEKISFEVVVFGHLGDGNLHINIAESGKMTNDEFKDKAGRFSRRVFEITKKFRGSISAEHGIGLLKKDDLHFSRSMLEISIMRQIKSIFDPHNIMNRGKIF